MKGVFAIVTKFIDILLTPINLLITNMLPSFDSVLTYVSNLFNSGLTHIGWIMDSLCLSGETISFLIAFWTFKLSFPLLVSSIKALIKWYNNLKL